MIGDLAVVLGRDGKPLPCVAQVAIQEGMYAAKTIVIKLKGKTAITAFEYFDKGDMAVIGRWSAVANIFGVHLSGFLAWLIWAFMHLMYLVQFQSRILVFTHWAFQALTFSRGARLITGPAAIDLDFNREMAREERADLPAPGRIP